MLGAYQFLEYKRDGDAHEAREGHASSATAAPRCAPRSTAGAAIADAVIVGARHGQHARRRRSRRPEVAADARKLLRGRGVTVQVLDVAAARQRNGSAACSASARARTQPPRFLKLTYTPAGARGKALALVGKGVVFDSGGLSLKTGARHGDDEERHVGRRGGDRARCRRSRELGVKTRVTGYVPLVENMPSGTAIRPGDVLRIRNGKTVEVLNTDAEGRLILADALSLASEDKPAAVIDLATLTGACVVALGEKIAGLMGNDDAWIAQVRARPTASASGCGRCRSRPTTASGIDSSVADMKNVGRRYGGALTAGLFLQEFVDGVPWVHLDIAGPAFRRRRRRLPPEGRHRLRRAHAGRAGRARSSRRPWRRHRRRRRRSRAPSGRRAR